MPSQRTLSSRWHDVFSARVKLACPESVASSNTVQTSGRLRLRAKKRNARCRVKESLVRAQKGVRGQLEGGCLRVSAATVRVSLGFPGVS